MTTPWWVSDDEQVTLYLGDSRAILPTLGPVETCLTDPVWPNSIFPAVSQPAELFAEVMALISCQRLIVHLGCASDPRFLMGVPASLPYLRTCWLRYARPSYRGRVLMGSDVAYVFGKPPASREGGRVLPGEVMARKNQTKLAGTGRGTGSTENADYQAMPHPTPRRLEHVQWLVSYFSEPGDTVLDPFAGTGTTLLAAKDLGRKAIGIEIDETYLKIARERLRQGLLL